VALKASTGVAYARSQYRLITMRKNRIIIDIEYGSDHQEEYLSKAMMVYLAAIKYTLLKGHKKNKVAITVDGLPIE
jgi:hypothetical protein